MADALTTAFMMMSVEEIDELCARTPGVEAWLLPDDDERAVGALRRIGRRLTSEQV